jgi:hypothetical protein
VLVLFAAIAPNAAWARGGWHGGYHGGHGGHGDWLPAVIIGGLVLGAVAVITAPFRALSGPPPAVPPVVYAPPAVYSPPPVYSAPPAYAPPPPTHQRAPAYAPPQAPAIQREVVFPHGRYVLYGDGVGQPWQWVWVPSTPAPPAPPAAQP